MIIQTTTGKETFRFSTTEVHAFYKANGTAKEMPLHVAVKDRHSGVVAANSPEFITASMHNINNGRWVRANYQVRPLSYMKILIKSKKPGEWVYRTGQFMIRFREDATLRRMRIPLAAVPESNLAAAYFEGRFDYIAPDDFESLGITLDNPSYIKQFEVDFTDFFEDQVIEWSDVKFTVPKVDKIVTKAGVVQVQRPAGRKLIIRR